MIAATILSAGASSRMGYPKAMLVYRERTFLQGILDALDAIGVRRRLVVVGHDHAKILSHHDLGGVTVLTNRALETGPIGSIRLSIEAVRHHPVRGLLVWPVDFPHVRLETVRSLVDTFRTTNPPITVPVYKGKRGHPVVFGRSVFDELVRAVDGEGANSVVNADSGRLREVPVEDEAVVAQLNTPRAYSDLLRREDLTRG